MSPLKQLTTLSSIALLTVSCANSQKPGSGIQASAIKQIGGSQHVRVMPGSATSKGTAEEAFHVAAQKNQKPGTYGYKTLSFHQNNHARASTTGLTSPYAGTPEAAIGNMVFNLAAISKDKPSTYSTSSFTRTQSPLFIAKGSKVRVSIKSSPNHTQDYNSADLPKMRPTVNKALSLAGLKVAKSANNHLEVRFLRTARNTAWVTAEMTFKKSSSARAVKAFIIAKASKGTPTEGEVSKAMAEALSNMLKIQ